METLILYKKYKAGLVGKVGLREGLKFTVCVDLLFAIAATVLVYAIFFN